MPFHDTPTEVLTAAGFTKGPWEAFTAHPDDVIDHEHSIMADSPPRVLLLVNLAHGSKDDLRLIAAAPDLYEALKNLTDACGDVRPFRGEIVDPGKDKVLDSKRAIDFIAAVDAANRALLKALPTQPAAANEQPPEDTGE